MAELFASATSYDRFMGRFSNPLASLFVELISPRPGQRALDVGSGTGAATRLLVDRLGAEMVSAVDPSEAFVKASRSLLPGVDIRIASAVPLPFENDVFDIALAQLVVHFMPDPVAGIAEMARVTRPDGLVAANVWDFGGTRGPLGVFERASRDLDPTSPTERAEYGATEGDLERIFTQAGLVDIWAGEHTVTVEFPTFDDWWEPFTLGVGPAGAYVESLDPAARVRLADHARELLPNIPFSIDATAWAATGRVPR